MAGSPDQNRNPPTESAPNTETGTGVALANAATSVKCERRAEVQHLHANELGPKGQLFDAVRTFVLGWLCTVLCMG